MSVYKIIEVNKLTLDKENPRIQAALEMYDPNDIDEIRMGMALGANTSQFEGSGTTYISLRDSIKTNGGIFNPIIVNHITSTDTYIVVEGNTRVHIYKEFVRSQVPGNWDKIPAIVYQDQDRNSMDSIRLQAHLVGPRQWDAYSKAKYLWKLSNEDNLTINQIIDYCGGKRKEVNEYIEGYKLMEMHYRPLVASDNEFDKSRFSAFVEVQRGTIQKSLLDNGFTVKDFAKWIYDDMFEKLELIRQLPRILYNPKAKETFIKKGAKAASDELIAQQAGNIDISRTTLDSLSRELTKKIRSLQYQELKDMRKDSDAISIISELVNELEDLLDEFYIEEDANA